MRGRSYADGDGIDNDCNGEVDEDCELTVQSGDAAKESGSCSCATSQSPNGWLFLAAILPLVALRRRIPAHSNVHLSSR